MTPAPTNVIGIDPGVKKCGIAYSCNGRLKYARLVTTESMLSEIINGKFMAVCEMPQTYGGRAKRGDTNDLLALARVVGQIEIYFRSVLGAWFVTVKPSEWKGQVPKQIMCRRIWKTLSAAEREVVGISPAARLALAEGRDIAKSATDVLDAVGIVLFTLGRLK